MRFEVEVTFLRVCRGVRWIAHESEVTQAMIAI
jgi:hypothetical protein